MYGNTFYFQHALVLPVLFGHLRFHECLGKFEEKIGHEFRDRYLLQVRFLIGLTLCLWKYDISDPTEVDLTSNFFVL